MLSKTGKVTNRSPRRYFLIVACAAACMALARVPLLASEVEITSEYLEYDEADRYMTAHDSVTVTWEGKTLVADSIRFWMDKKLLKADGNVALCENNTTMYGESITYNYENETGTIEKPHGYSDPTYFCAAEAEKRGEKDYKLDGMSLTTCNLPDPHYTIRAKRARIKLGKRITIYNAVFYLRRVPLFYVPYFTKGLGGGRKDSLEIQPGYNNSDGLIIRTIYGYPVSEHGYGKLYLDYFSKRGWGTGAEYTYELKNKLKGTIYGYHIKERTTGNERWTTRAAYWQKIDPLWTAQAEADFESDSTFNDTYFLENWQRVNQQLHSFAAFTRQSSRSNTRITAERYDVFNSSSGAFEPSTITLPRVDYTHYSSKTRLPFTKSILPGEKGTFYNNFSGSIQNQYLMNNKYYMYSGSFDENITKDYRVGRKLTLKPRLGIAETWQDRTSSTTLTDQFLTHYYADLNLRYRVVRWIDWDLGYNYRLRTEKNSLLIDYWADDYGEETNRLTFVNSMYIQRLTIRNSTGYDLRQSRTVETSWDRKFSPLVNELTWTPPYGFYVYFREENSISPLDLRTVQTDMRFGNIEKKFFSLGVFYNYSQPDNLDFTSGFGFWAGPKWRFDYTLGLTSMDRFSSYRFNSQELKVYRDLHCWQLKLTYRRRINVEEILFQLELKSSAQNKKRLYNTAAEKEFYPWR